MQTALVPLIGRRFGRELLIAGGELSLGGGCVFGRGKTPGKGVAELSHRIWEAEQKASFSI